MRIPVERILQIKSSLRCRVILAIVILLGCAWGDRPLLRAAEPDEVGFLLFEDPPLEFPPRGEEPQESRVDLDGLAASQPRERVRTARWLLSDIAAGRVVPPETAERVASALSETSRHSTLQRVLVSALLALEAKTHAETLWTIAGDDLTVASAVERSLIRWQSDLAVSTWRKRLRDQESPPDRLVLAIEGLTAVGSAADIPWIVQRLNPASEPVVAVAAAWALAELRPEGNGELSRRLVRSGRDSDRPHRLLLAALLLTGDGSESARETLMGILSDGSDPARRVALRTLHRHHSETATELAHSWVQRGGASVREAAIEILGGAPSEAGIRTLVGGLDDPERRLRRAARRHLLDAASDPQLRPVVIEEVLQKSMEGGSWRSLEQAILLLTALDQQQIVPALMEHLEHPRGDVSVTASWGLKVLVQDPDTVDRVAEKVDQWTRQPGPELAQTQAERHQVHRLAHLLELLGKHRHHSSDEVFRRLVPQESGFNPMPRAAAVWALGRIWQTDAPADLIEQLRLRMLDLHAEYPDVAEVPLVGYAVVNTLGRIAGSELIDDLKIFVTPDTEAPPVGAAAAWAIEQIQQRENAASDAAP